MEYINELFVNILSMSTIASVAFGMILLARGFIKNKVKLSKSALLWIIFVSLLIIPINFSSSLSIKNYINANDNVFVNLFKMHFFGEPKFENAEADSFFIDGTDSDFLDNRNILISPEKSKNENSYVSIFAYIWLIVAIILIAKDIYIYTTFSKVNHPKKAPEKLVNTLNVCKQKLGITGNIDIIMQEDIKTPSICGMWNTKILLSNEILGLSDDELEYVILHELNHYKKFHHVYYLIFTIIADLHWFNPIVKLAIKTIKEDLEIITDEQVIKLGAPIKEYCKTILKVAAIACDSMRLVPTICNEKSEIERRIIYMKDKKTYSKFSLVILVLTVAIISIVSISLASDKVEKNSENDALSTANDVFYETIEDAENADTSVNYVLPVKDGKISAKYGRRAHPITGEELFHSGVDIALEEGEDVYAIADGEIIYAGFDANNGNSVEVKHADGSVSKYNHGLEILVDVGDEVKAGEKIMLVGKTGMATGAHLHLEVKNKNGEYVDINYMFE